MGSIAKISYNHQRSVTSKIRRLLAYVLPASTKRTIRIALALPCDLLNAALGRTEPLIPPRHMNLAGDGDFVATGNEFFRYFVDLAGIKPSDRVLEIGCGIGRMARPLAAYLTSGVYEGIDIIPESITWCQEHYAGYPNFRFRLADIRNSLYNPHGAFDANDYRFPYPDNSVDFVFLTSVLTHMFRSDTENYLREIGRVLRSGGRSLITFFLLNNESAQWIARGESSFTFEHVFRDTKVEDHRSPERAVAYDESWLYPAYKAAGLAIESVHYGVWCGRPDFLSYQDIVIASKI